MRQSAMPYFLMLILRAASLSSCKTSDDGSSTNENGSSSKVFWSDGRSEFIDAQLVGQLSNGNIVVIGKQHLGSNELYLDTGSAGQTYRLSILNYQGNEIHSDEIAGISEDGYARNFGSLSLNIDDNNNIIVTGTAACARANCHSFAGYAGPLAYSGVYASFIAKWSSNGKLLWEKYLGLSDLPAPLANWKYMPTQIFTLLEKPIG